MGMITIHKQKIPCKKPAFDQQGHVRSMWPAGATILMMSSGNDIHSLRTGRCSIEIVDLPIQNGDFQ
jgi:hypothetical protein